MLQYLIYNNVKNSKLHMKNRIVEITYNLLNINTWCQMNKIQDVTLMVNWGGKIKFIIIPFIKVSYLRLYCVSNYIISYIYFENT